MSNESVGKKIVEALKKQAESIDIAEENNSMLFDEPVNNEIFDTKDDFFCRTC